MTLRRATALSLLGVSPGLFRGFFGGFRGGFSGLPRRCIHFGRVASPEANVFRAVSNSTAFERIVRGPPVRKSIGFTVGHRARTGPIGL